MKRRVLKAKVNKFFPTGKGNSTKKELSYQLQKWSAIAGIGGAFLGILLSMWSIGISIQASNNATKIEKMDSLIDLLANQNQKQDSQIVSLKNLQVATNEMNKGISDQIHATLDQSYFFNQATRPFLDIDSIRVDSSLEGGSYQIDVAIKNYGSRTAENVKVAIYLFVFENDLIPQPLDSLIGPFVFSQGFEKGFDFMAPGQSATDIFQIDSLPIGGENMALESDDLSSIQNGCLGIRYKYYDRLIKKNVYQDLKFFRLGSNHSNTVWLVDPSTLTTLNVLRKKCNKYKF